VVEKLILCVPNISEGRDRAKVESIAAAVEETPGARLLDLHMDADHNRSVLTLAGPPEAVFDAAVRLACRAVKLIDLNSQTGAHPRIGALDVLPFVPLRGVSIEDCAVLAAEAGAEIFRRTGVPSYLYEAAARRPGRCNLADIRRGEFEGLRVDVLRNAARRPDIGGPALHPTAGAIAIGARNLMIAYNIQLGTADVEVARRIARKIRFSSGGLPHVKAIGLYLPRRHLAQVSMNLTGYEVTPPHVVFEAVSEAARLEGTTVRASELIGLIPRKALDLAAGRDLLWENLTPSSILENRL
jgi:glutamate formiminotransferase